MAKITRIKARDSQDDKPAKIKTEQPAIQEAELKPAKKSKQKPVKAPKEKKEKKPRKGIRKVLYVLATPFRWIAKPFQKLGAYIAASWREIRQVRWPDRKLSWKLTVTVIAYTLFITVVIGGLDILFSFIFNQIIK